MMFRLFWASLLALLAVTMPGIASAQVAVTGDWTNLGLGSLQEVNDNSVLDVGINTVTINTNVVTDGDANDASFTNFYSTGMLSYYNGQISSNTGVLLYSTDHTVFDAGDFFETTYTFGTAVQQLEFTVGNVDRFFGNVDFHDAVVIEYDTGNGTWLNLRNLSGATTLGSAVATTTINGQQGWHGTAYSGGITSTTGDIRVDFGTTTVERVRIRYLFGQDFPNTDVSGNFQYMGVSDFNWEQPNVPTADLSLTKSVSNSTPSSGSAINYTLSVTNSGPDAATNVEVLDLLPTGFDFTNASGFGSYNETTGVWTISSVASGQTRTLTINGTVTAPNGVTITNNAEIQSSDLFDSDSTPGNNSANEDDDDFASFTVQGTRTAGTPPTLICPAGSNLFDWDTTTWVAGSLNNTYTMPSFGDLNIALSADGTFVNDPSFGGQSPTNTNRNTGGFAIPENSLHMFMDFDNRQQTGAMTVTLPNGIAGTQFTIFDVDFAANDFADKVTVVGTYQGNTVIPVLTNGVANYVVGNTAVGDATSGNTSGNGNVVVTFSQPIDGFTVTYGNASTAPPVPDGQAITFHDFTFCAPDTSLSVTKVSSVVSDPVNLTDNPKRIPGATIEYQIAVTNTGVSDTDPGTVVVTDNGPPEAKLCQIAQASGPIVYSDADNDSNLTYTFGALNNTLDDLEFSNDNGATWTYVPSDEGDGCDSAVTNFRVRPDGAFAGGGDFAVRVRYVIE